MEPETDGQECRTGQFAPKECRALVEAQGVEEEQPGGGHHAEAEEEQRRTYGCNSGTVDPVELSLLLSSMCTPCKSSDGELA